MRIILADEISPDNCRLWDCSTNEKMDKDRFRRDLGNVEEGYTKWRAASASCPGSRSAMFVITRVVFATVPVALVCGIVSV